MLTFILATLVYGFSMSITPGPTNIILMTTGVNHGFRATVPFATGALFGFCTLIATVALGLGSMITENETVMGFIAYIGSALICYMGYKVAFSAVNFDEEVGECPSFIEGAVLQWLNAKAWIACIAGVSAFNLAVGGSRLMIYVLVYGAVGYFSILLWGYAGSKISHFLKKEKNLKIFNMIMGASLVLVAIYLLMMER